MKRRCPVCGAREQTYSDALAEQQRLVAVLQAKIAALTPAAADWAGLQQAGEDRIHASLAAHAGPEPMCEVRP